MAQFNRKPYASSCEIKQIALYKPNGEEAEANLLDMALFIQYHESILWPAYGATLVLIDNGENLISSLPITGFEKIVFETNMSLGDRARATQVDMCHCGSV